MKRFWCISNLSVQRQHVIPAWHATCIHQCVLHKTPTGPESMAIGELAVDQSICALQGISTHASVHSFFKHLCLIKLSTHHFGVPSKALPHQSGLGRVCHYALQSGYSCQQHSTDGRRRKYQVSRFGSHCNRIILLPPTKLPPYSPGRDHTLLSIYSCPLLSNLCSEKSVNHSATSSRAAWYSALFLKSIFSFLRL